MGEMRNFIIGKFRNNVAYYPELRQSMPELGSVFSTILFTQMEFYFGLPAFQDGFYKFLSPVPEKDRGGKKIHGHELYREGDSWTEKLGCTEAEFRCAFDSLGVRYPSVSTYRAAAQGGDPFLGKFYLSVRDCKTNVTRYFRNHQVVDAAIDKVMTEMPEKPKKSSTLENRGAGNMATEKKESCTSENGGAEHRESEVQTSANASCRDADSAVPSIHRETCIEDGIDTHNKHEQSCVCDNDNWKSFLKSLDANELKFAESEISRAPADLRQAIAENFVEWCEAGVLSSKASWLIKVVESSIARKAFIPSKPYALGSNKRGNRLAEGKWSGFDEKDYGAGIGDDGTF